MYSCGIHFVIRAKMLSGHSRNFRDDISAFFTKSSRESGPSLSRCHYRLDNFPWIPLRRFFFGNFKLIALVGELLIIRFVPQLARAWNLISLVGRDSRAFMIRYQRLAFSLARSLARMARNRTVIRRWSAPLFVTCEAASVVRSFVDVGLRREIRDLWSPRTSRTKSKPSLCAKIDMFLPIRIECIMRRQQPGRYKYL